MFEGEAELRRQLLRFVIVGTASVAVDAMVYYALTSPLGLPLTPSKGASYVAGMAVGFAGNKLWTFGSVRRAAGEPITYVLIYMTTWALNMACNAWVVTWVVPGNRPVAFLAATAVSTVLNFLGMRYITFRRGIAERVERDAEDD